MAEIRELTVKIKADTSGLKDIAGASESVGKRMDKALNRAVFHAKEFGIGLKEGLTGVERPAQRAISTFEFFDKKIVSTNAAILGLTVAATGVITATTAFGAGILAAAKAAADYGEQIDLVRARTGLSAESISFMAAVAKENQATLNDVAIAARHLNTELVEFARGQKTATRSFAELGLNAADFTRAGNDINEILPLVIEQLAGMENHSQKAALAVALFGENGDKLLPTFEAIAKDGEQLKKTFTDLGLVIDNETASAAARFNQSLDRLKGAVEGIRLTVGNEFIPILTDLIEKLTEWVASNKELIGQNVEAFIDGVKVAVDNLSSAFNLLSPEIDGVTGEFNTMTQVMVTVNEILILMAKGILAVDGAILTYKKGILSLTELAAKLPGGIGPTPEQLEATRKAVEESQRGYNDLADDIAKAEDKLNKYIAAQSGPGQEAARTQARLAAQLIAQFQQAGVVFGITREELDRLGKSSSESLQIIKDEAKKTKSAIEQLNESLLREIESIRESNLLIGLEGAARIEAESAILRQKGALEELVKVRESELKRGLEGEFLKTIEDLITQIEKETSALGASNSELRQMAIDALQARLALEVFSEEGLKEAEAKLRAFEQALIDLDLKRTAQEAGDAFKTLEEEFGLLPDKVLDLKNEFDSLGPFIGQVASDIAQTFSDMFDKLSFDWKSLLNNLKRAFFDFVGALIANPIRLALDATLGGGSGKGAQGAAQQGAGLLSGVTGLGGTLGLGSSGLFGASGSFTALSALFTGNSAVGFGSTLLGAIPAIGAILTAAFIGASILVDVLKKTPRLDIDFDSVKTDIGRRAALVSEFLDPEFFAESIAQISVKRKAGLGVGGDEKIIELIQGRIQETIESVQGIINKLPSELAATLNDSLLNSVVDIETVVAGERLLEFDAKGKKIKEKFEAFINGELQAKFLFAIRDFFTGAFESLGVLPENAQSFIDAEFERFQRAGSREERAAIGQDLLASFDTFVNAFNIISGNGSDSINAAINQVHNLSRSLGFEAIPSLEELRLELGRVVENAEIDPEVVQSFIDLRAALLQLQSAVLGSISSIISNIQSLNAQIVSFGGSAVDLTGFLNDAIGSIQGILGQGGLSLDEQEALLGELGGFVNQLLAEEQAAFQKEQEAIRAAAEAAAQAQRAGIQARIDSLNQEKDRINETFRARIDALNEELRIAEQFARLTESVRDTLDSILFSPESVLTGVEQVNILQGRINELQSQLASTGDPETQLRLGEELRDAFETIFRSAGDAFGINSPEFVSIFDQVTGGLSDLATLTENSGRSAEEIQAEIERLTALNNEELKRIDASIQAAQTQLASIQTQTAQATFQASERAQELLEYLRGEYVRILEERFKQLGEISSMGFTTELEGLSAIAATSIEQLVTLKDQTSYLAQIAGAITNGGSTAAGVPGFASGSGGLMDFGQRTLAFLHGREAVFTEPQLANLTRKLTSAGYVSSLANQLPNVQGRSSVTEVNEGDIHINLSPSFTINSSSPNVDKMLPALIENTMVESIKRGRLRGAVQDAARRKLD
jgi:hypothetical protein